VNRISPDPPKTFIALTHQAITSRPCNGLATDQQGPRHGEFFDSNRITTPFCPNWISHRFLAQSFTNIAFTQTSPWLSIREIMIGQSWR
jgi:hypothetical protein